MNNDQLIRNEIIECKKNNIVVDASAGSGKTTIMVEKMLWILSNNKFPIYSKILLITFTNNAKNQIQTKIKEFKIQEKYQKVFKEQEDYIQVQTNDSFVANEVIRPFLREALGKEYPKEWDEDYSVTFYSIEEALKYLKEYNVLGVYQRDIQKNGENLKFDIALQVLKKSINARKYIITRFPYMFVDEYQDVDASMHDFFMYLKTELNVKLFIVGDIKQAIYKFRGADKLFFKSLQDDPTFEKYTLMQNFRSHITIQNFVNKILGRNTSNDIAMDRVIFYEDNMDWGKIVSTYQMDSMAIMVGINSRAETIAENQELKNQGFLFVKTPFNSADKSFSTLLPFLTLKHNEGYTETDLLKQINQPITEKNVERVNGIFRELNRDINNGLDIVGDWLEENISNKSKQNFIEAFKVKYKSSYDMELSAKRVLTLHSSKGLEFDTVIVDSASFFNRDRIKFEEHYVGITRAKEWLIIIMTPQYKKYLLENKIVKPILFEKN